jgi:hypothetical protein
MRLELSDDSLRKLLSISGVRSRKKRQQIKSIKKTLLKTLAEWVKEQT